MCGRYTVKTPAQKLAQTFEIDPDRFPPLSPRFNVSPTQKVLVVRLGREGKWELAFLRWGLVPSWSKDPKQGPLLINARAETVAEKPTFRAAFQRRRCLVAADGFFEWKTDGATKTPYYITLAGGPPFAFPGLWEEWHGEDGAVIESCTIVTTAANEFMRSLHHRMPVILTPAEHGKWMEPRSEKNELLALLRQYPSEALRAWPVSTVVNSPKNDSPACVVKQAGAPYVLNAGESDHSRGCRGGFGTTGAPWLARG